MIEYVIHEVIRRPGILVDEDTPLVSSGLVDSFALVDILTKLSEVLRLRIPASKVQPSDMDTIRLMFATAERVGKLRP